MLHQGELKQQNLSVFSYGGKDLLGYFYQNGHATQTGASSSFSARSGEMSRSELCFLQLRINENTKLTLNA